jgi:UDP-N-acetylglucosamine 2-epimerase (non-hydrolysing)
MAPLVVALRAELGFFDVSVCVTAQHRQMLDQVLEWFSIQPDVDLDLMAPGQDLFDLTSRILLSMRNALRQEKPNVVLVHGDTTTAFATALACFYEGIPVGHVEAGLRTYDLSKPFPEEMNRQFVGKVAHWHFSPTLLSKRNLLKEGASEDSILVTGNTVIDALKLKRMYRFKTGYAVCLLVLLASILRPYLLY